MKSCSSPIGRFIISSICDDQNFDSDDDNDDWNAAVSTVVLDDSAVAAFGNDDRPVITVVEPSVFNCVVCCC